MSCSKTRETDWSAYAADPTSDEWAELRAHYPVCEDCSREAARWTALRLELAARETPAHPDEAELLAFDRQPAELAAARHAQIEAHVGDCRRCQNELVVLNAMLPVRSLSDATAGAEPAEEGAGLFGWLSDWLAPPRLAGAIGVAIVLLIGAVIALQLAGPRSSDEPPRLAQDDPAPERPEPTPPRTPQPPPSEAPRLAERPSDVPPTREPIEPETDQREGPESPAPSPERLAERPEPPKAPTRPGPSPSEPPTPSDPEPVREIQLAALVLPSRAPLYDPTAVPLGADLLADRLDDVIRTGGTDAEIRVVAPRHRAITFERSPRLYWHLSGASDRPVELALVDQTSDERIFERTLEAPVRAGLHALDLGAEGVRLEPGRPYGFFASILIDPDRPDRNVLSGMPIVSRPDAAPAAGDDPAERPEALARAGSWLDAFATLQGWLEQEPGLPRAAAHRAALLEQADRAEVARWLEDGARSN